MASILDHLADALGERCLMAQLRAKPIDLYFWPHPQWVDRDPEVRAILFNQRAR